MTNRGIVFALVALFVLWLFDAFEPTAKVCEPPKPAPLPSVAPYEAPESLSVANDRPAVIIVADLSQGFGAKWLSDDAEKLRSKGWEVRSVDVRGLQETRFYVGTGGQWQIHAGPMSLGGLKAMLAR